MLTYDPLLSSITLLHAFTMEIGMVCWLLRAATCVKLQLPHISSSKKTPSVRFIINRWKKFWSELQWLGKKKDNYSDNLIFFMNSRRRGLSFESEESFQAARDVCANFNESIST